MTLQPSANSTAQAVVDDGTSLTGTNIGPGVITVVQN